MDTIDIKILDEIEKLENSPALKEFTHQDIGLINSEELRNRLNNLINQNYVRGKITVINSGHYNLRDYSLREKGKQVLLQKRFL